MKVLILSVADKRHMPMVAPFVSFFRKNNIDYDVIRSNRYEEHMASVVIHERTDGKDYEIDMVMPIDMPRWKKTTFFIKYFFRVKAIISRNTYDYIVVWNENTAALFSKYLTKKYAGKYCVNIRDPIEDLGILKKLAIKAVEKANFTTIPTPDLAGKELKNKDRIITLYNRDYRLLEEWEIEVRKREQLPIRLTHLGFYAKAVRGAKEMADMLGNDERFELLFCGTGFDEEYRDYVEAKGYKNIYTEGAFKTEKTKEYLEKTDIINSYYNMFEQPGLINSFGIKHSYTPMLYIPGLADENTTWGRMCKPYNIAFLVNDENKKDLPDALYNWYRDLDYDVFKESCDSFNKIIDASIERMYELLEEQLLKETEVAPPNATS